MARVITWVCASVFLHIALLAALNPIWPWISEPPQGRSSPPQALMVLEPYEPEEPLVEPEEELDGQLVDLPEPKEQEKPIDADYLAEHQRTVEEETRSERYRINPEVLAPEFSLEDKIEMADLVDVNATEDSTGATVGNDRFDPDRDGRLAALPSPYAVTNKDGLQAPVRASHATQSIAGAPNNDLLDEKVGVATQLNTKEFLYATYINQIRRLVNFYWNQNLDNLPPGMPLAKSSYETVVNVTITKDGLLEHVEILHQSGEPSLDNCVVEAFRIAGPFPAPPAGLVDKDGRARIPDFGFTVQVGQAQARYEGIDPRSGVQFPGILKAPR